MAYSETQREQAREHLVKSRLYKFLAGCFLVVAFMIFAVFYNMFADGTVMSFLKNPFLIGMMLFPFVPAYAFALMSKRRRSKAVKILSEAEKSD